MSFLGFCDTPFLQEKNTGRMKQFGRSLKRVQNEKCRKKWDTRSLSVAVTGKSWHLLHLIAAGIHIQVLHRCVQNYIFPTLLQNILSTKCFKDVWYNTGQNMSNFTFVAHSQKWLVQLPQKIYQSCNCLLNTMCWNKAAGTGLGWVIDPAFSIWQWLRWYSEA